MKPKTYSREHIKYVAYPLGGTGAGMFCIEGTGAFSHFSFYHRPEVFNEPYIISALCLKGKDKNTAVVLEGQVPEWKIFRQEGGGNGLYRKSYGLARFKNSAFTARFPFGTVELTDEDLPVKVEITGWSPFIPNNTFDSCLPVAGVEYTFCNNTGTALDMVFSFHCSSFLSPKEPGRGRTRVSRTQNGLMYEFMPETGREFDRGWFSVECDSPGTAVDPRWLRGFMFDDLMNMWRHVENGDVVDDQPYPYTDDRQSPGGSIYVPLSLPSGESRTIVLRFSWYVPDSNLRVGAELGEGNTACCSTACCCNENTETRLPGYRPWYASQFSSIHEVSEYWRSSYEALRRETRLFTDTLYSTTLDDEIMDAVVSNLCILKSPTILRQHDGRLWAWEGCCDSEGCCHGSCTHVWNYAQAICHLFPELERSLRYTEFNESQDEQGHQNFRSSLPIRECDHSFHAAADGQLGGIIKLYRDYHICGDRQWLMSLWPKAKQSLEYCISLWDRDRSGQLKYPHHNTYDIEFWGPSGMTQSIYVPALKAMALLCVEVGEDNGEYERLYGLAKEYLESELYNGEYFYQKVMHEELGLDYLKLHPDLTPESIELVKKEGPHYQYGTGCLSDGIIGDWMGFSAGLENQIDSEKVTGHLKSVYRYNYKPSLLRHSNVQRPSYALSDEGGLVLCTWPDGSKPTLRMIYADEVWTGIEYQVAAHMASKGLTEEALRIVKSARKRYDGTVRNPFNEYECGHWYGRALSSYSLLQGFTGIRYDAVTGKLTIAPRLAGDFTSFLCTAFGYGLAGVKNGEPFYKAVAGNVEIKDIEYIPYDSRP